MNMFIDLTVHWTFHSLSGVRQRKYTSGYITDVTSSITTP